MLPTFHLHNSPVFLSALTESFPGWLVTQRYSQVFVLADENTQRLCLPYFLRSTGLEDNILLTVIPSGESEKTFVTCLKVWESMLTHKLDRKALIINLGGGVIGDLGGFCAATWKRGIDFVQIPTTLLAMTDAAIGGKTGIDFQGVKNTIGVFQQPAAVFVDPFFLQTLPERELRSGFAEVIKHALIGESGLLEQIASNDSFQTLDWLDILQKSIAVKVRIVEQDPREQSLRMLLNFGHSIGHALESYCLASGKPLTHGEAVAIGMICEAPSFLQKKVVKIVTRYFPHHAISGSSFPAIWSLMQQDKKNSSGAVRMAVPDEKPYTLQIIETDQTQVESSLAFYNALK